MVWCALHKQNQTKVLHADLKTSHHMMDKIQWFKNLKSIPQKKLRVQVVNNSIILVVIPS